MLNLLLAATAGATILGLLGALTEWLYQIGRPGYTLWGPIIAGALLGLVLAALTKAKDTLPIGLVIYYITRTFLNALRSVEALVMAIVFVIAVGIGPFAGVMALGLHTIVSLAKLYSEQVESILPGPLEAIEATGANRLQTIIYAVVPQIIPPYISYTMYRWDINVRMSTIIGFVGGGGIGFLLQQNINLLNYRAASAQMLAIAVVVASMDYISSVLREKYV
jgi:phosphonate transport system permease protein